MSPKPNLKKFRKKNPPIKPYLETRLKQLEGEFNAKAREFQHLMENAGGLKNVWMLDCIRDLNMLYLQIAAFTEAARIAGYDA
jgi:hypothetical protein